MNRLSVIIPIYNEEDNVEVLYDELKQVLNEFNREYEIIFVDDGSSDKSLDKLIELSSRDSKVKVIEFRRNFGQTAAMAAGLENSEYEVIITMDGDLQNDPSSIPSLIEKLEEGYDLVAGWRKDRKDKFLSRRLPSIMANWLISRSTKVHLHDYGCSLKVMTREIAKEIKLYGEMHRFIPALADQAGAKIVEMPVNHRARIHGTSKYGISRTIRVVLDLITVKFLLGFSKRPIHLFGLIGLLTGGLGSLMLFILMIEKFILSLPIGNRPLLPVGIMMVMIGLQFLVFGLLAEVLARTYYESQDKSIYTIRKIYKQAD